MAETRKFVTVDQSDSSGTLQDVNEVSFPVELDTVYDFDFIVRYSTVSTSTGFGVAVTCPSGAAISYQAILAESGSMSSSGAAHGQGDASGELLMIGVTPSGTCTGRIFGVLINGPTAGNLTLQFRTETAGNQATVKKGTVGTLRSQP